MNDKKRLLKLIEKCYKRFDYLTDKRTINNNSIRIHNLKLLLNK